MGNIPKRLQQLIPAVRQAGEIMRRHYRTELNISRKTSAFDLVTQVDQEVERILLDALRTNEPTTAIVSEEAHFVQGAPQKADIGRDTHAEAWVIDPLDGTANYAMGIPFFCISIALCRGSRPQLALIHSPLDDDWFIAERGKGATLNGQPMRVSTSPIEEAMMSMRIKKSDRRLEGDLSPLLSRAGGMRSFGAAALELAYVACGRLAAYQEQNLHFWDVAAGTLLVEEAGGSVELWQQSDIDPSRQVEGGIPVRGWHVMATNQTLQRQMKQQDT